MQPTVHVYNGTPIQTLKILDGLRWLLCRRLLQSLLPNNHCDQTNNAVNGPQILSGIDLSSDKNDRGDSNSSRSGASGTPDIHWRGVISLQETYLSVPPLERLAQPFAKIDCFVSYCSSCKISKTALVYKKYS